MRAWKKAKLPVERIFIYFREHPDKFFNEDHVAAQVGIGRRRTRKLVAWLVAEHKLEAVETVTSAKWGRPKLMFRAIRTNEDSVRQLEVFRDSLASAGLGDPFG